MRAAIFNKGTFRRIIALVIIANFIFTGIPAGAYTLSPAADNLRSEAQRNQDPDGGDEINRDFIINAWGKALLRNPEFIKLFGNNKNQIGHLLVGVTSQMPKGVITEEGIKRAIELYDTFKELNREQLAQVIYSTIQQDRLVGMLMADPGFFELTHFNSIYSQGLRNLAEQLFARMCLGVITLENIEQLLQDQWNLFSLGIRTDEKIEELAQLIFLITRTNSLVEKPEPLTETEEECLKMEALGRILHNKALPEAERIDAAKQLREKRIYDANFILKSYFSGMSATEVLKVIKKDKVAEAVYNLLGGNTDSIKIMNLRAPIYRLDIKHISPRLAWYSGTLLPKGGDKESVIKVALQQLDEKTYREGILYTNFFTNESVAEIFYKNRQGIKLLVELMLSMGGPFTINNIRDLLYQNIRSLGFTENEVELLAAAIPALTMSMVPTDGGATTTKEESKTPAQVQTEEVLEVLDAWVDSLQANTEFTGLFGNEKGKIDYLVSCLFIREGIKPSLNTIKQVLDSGWENPLAFNLGDKTDKKVQELARVIYTSLTDGGVLSTNLARKKAEEALASYRIGRWQAMLMDMDEIVRSDEDTMNILRPNSFYAIASEENIDLMDATRALEYIKKIFDGRNIEVTILAKIIELLKFYGYSSDEAWYNLAIAINPTYAEGVKEGLNIEKILIAKHFQGMLTEICDIIWEEKQDSDITQTLRFIARNKFIDLQNLIEAQSEINKLLSAAYVPTSIQAKIIELLKINGYFSDEAWYNLALARDPSLSEREKEALSIETTLVTRYFQVMLSGVCDIIRGENKTYQILEVLGPITRKRNITSQDRVTAKRDITEFIASRYTVIPDTKSKIITLLESSGYSLYDSLNEEWSKLIRPVEISPKEESRLADYWLFNLLANPGFVELFGSYDEAQVRELVETLLLMKGDFTEENINSLLKQYPSTFDFDENRKAALAKLIHSILTSGTLDTAMARQRAEKVERVNAIQHWQEMVEKIATRIVESGTSYDESVNSIIQDLSAIARKEAVIVSPFEMEKVRTHIDRVFDSLRVPGLFNSIDIILNEYGYPLNEEWCSVNDPTTENKPIVEVGGMRIGDGGSMVQLLNEAKLVNRITVSNFTTYVYYFKSGDLYEMGGAALIKVNGGLHAVREQLVIAVEEGKDVLLNHMVGEYLVRVRDRLSPYDKEATSKAAKKIAVEILGGGYRKSIDSFTPLVERPLSAEIIVTYKEAEEAMSDSKRETTLSARGVQAHIAGANWGKDLGLFARVVSEIDGRLPPEAIELHHKKDGRVYNVLVSLDDLVGRSPEGVMGFQSMIEKLRGKGNIKVHLNIIGDNMTPEEVNNKVDDAFRKINAINKGCTEISRGMFETVVTGNPEQIAKQVEAATGAGIFLVVGPESYASQFKGVITIVLDQAGKNQMTWLSKAFKLGLTLIVANGEITDEDLKEIDKLFSIDSRGNFHVGSQKVITDVSEAAKEYEQALDKADIAI